MNSIMLTQSPLQNNAWFDLNYLGLIKVSGSEAKRFLQGQLTHDVNQVDQNHSQLTAWCNAKGRVIANFRLFQRAGAHYLLLPKENIETVIKRLKMYVLRSDVVLEAVDATEASVGLSGVSSTQALGDCLHTTPPVQMHDSITAETCTILRIAAEPRYILIGDRKTIETIRPCLLQTLSLAEATQWQLLDILAGLPQVTPVISEAFIPQMLNWQALDGISFKKGCYTGQEVVARTQYLGHLKRRLFLVRTFAVTSLQPGDELYVSDQAQRIGRVVNSQVHPEGGTVALVVLSTHYAQSNEVTLHKPYTGPLQLLDLPYTLDE
jgi:hypothetical protein